MEVLTIVLAALVALIGFDLAALRWGTDTRPSLRDRAR